MAARFWVGGTGTWDAADTTHWSATSGGASGASVPGSGDTVTLDGASGGGTVTVAYDPSVTSITMGAFTGTLDMNTRNPTMQTFNNSGTGTRTLTMGSGTWTLTGNNTTIWNSGTTTGLTHNSGTSIINCTYSGSVGTRTINSGTSAVVILNTFKVSAGSDIINYQGASTDNDFTGFTGALNYTSGSNIYGSYTLGAGMTTTAGSFTLTFKATSSKNITTNGVMVNFPITFDGVGGTWVLQDNLTLDSVTPRVITLTNGTWNTNAKTVSMGSFSCNDNNIKVLTITNSTINITTTANGTVFNVANGSGGAPSNLTVNATGSTINFVGSTIGTVNSQTFSGGAKNWGNLVFNGPLRPSISFSNGFTNLSILGQVAKENRFTCAVDQTVTGTTTITGSAANRVLVIGSGTGFEGTQRTINTAVAAFSYVDFQDMRITGAAAPAGGTSIGDCFNNTSITTDAPRTLYWVGNAGNWSDTAHWSLTSGGASGQPMPLPQDTVIVDANSVTLAGQTISMDVCRPGLNIDFSAVLNSPTLAMRSSNIQGTSFYGDLIFAPTMTVTGSDSADLCTRTTSNWNPAGITFPNSWVIRAANSGIVTQLGNYISTGATGFSISLGKLNVNGYNNQTNTVTVATFTSGGNRNQAIDWGTGTWSLIGTGTVLNITTTALTSTPNTGTIKLTDSSATVKIVAGGGFSYPNLLISGTGTGKVTITGNNTWLGILDNNPTAHTIEFTASTTQIISAGGWGINGSPSATVTIQSSSAGTPFTISISSGLVRSQYLSIKDSTATGGAYFQAVNSTDVSGNTGWNFSTSGGGGSRVGGRIVSFGGRKPYVDALDSNLDSYRKLGG